MRKMLRLFAALMVTASLAGCAGGQASETPKAAPAGAQAEGEGGSAKAWKPEKDINVIVAYKAGSGTDTGARILCSIAEKYVGRTLLIVNKEGADGKIGYTELANAKPDGYTIGFINLPTYAQGEQAALSEGDRQQRQ